MRKQVKTKPDVQEKLIPTYEMGCKRITPSDVYLKVRNPDKNIQYIVLFNLRIFITQH